MIVFQHEALGGGMHRFLFPSQTRRGVRHSLLLDFEATGRERMQCSCDAAMFGRLCKHARWILNGPAGVRA